MGLDPLSPIAPARVRVLLLPVGRIRRSRFLGFVDRLRPHCVVRLGDVSADARPNRNMFSPLAFPTGLMLYDLTLSLPAGSQSTLAPFELFREPMIVVGIVDGLESSDAAFGGLPQELDEMRDRFPKALVRQVLVFDHSSDRPSRPPSDGIVTVPAPERSKTTTIKTIMCDFASLLLAEFTTFAKSLQGLPSIESPRSADNPRMSNGFGPGYSSHSDPWGPNNPPTLTRSQSGTMSPAADKAQYRMSMPAQLPSSSDGSSGAIAGARSKSPPSRAETPPPTTLDDVAGGTRPPHRTSLANAASRSSAAGARRDSSHDRISVHGFGSGSLSERARNKGKGRIGLVIGAIYLNAGRWGDAVRELVESATIARANNDHLWHAKALENIVVGLLMFAWAGMDFQIPQICYPIVEKSSSSTGKTQPTTGSTSELDQSAHGSAPNRLVSLQNLTSLLPDLLNNILNLYTRASNFSGESLPELAFAESAIRFSKLLCAIHLSDGKMDDDALQCLVLNTPLPSKPTLTLPRTAIIPTRAEITSLLFRAFPSSSLTTTQSVTDRVLVLAGIASVLSSIGLHRKKAFVMRELITVLTPGLVQARKLGAAEMGVHPAAGLAALKAISGGFGGAGAVDLGQGDVDNGLGEFLGALGRVYGVISSDTVPQSDYRQQQDVPSDPDTRPPHVDSNDVVIGRILQNSTLRSFGGQSLKLNILRNCINLCEALPDFQGVLRYTTELLRTAGSGIAPEPDSDEGSTSLSRDEQVRLATNITRAVSAAKRVGVDGIEAEYWDEFLVRGVEVLEPPASRLPVPRGKPELETAEAAAEKKEKSPFIYNPFLKRPDPAAVEKLLVAGEYTEFKITLQNPFEFDIAIERMLLESEGVEFDSVGQGTAIGSYRTKLLSLFGTPKAAGSLKITGCIVKIKGCRERRFPIFSDPWSPRHDSKIKSIGLAASEARITRPGSGMAAPATNKSISPLTPKPACLVLNVILEQPVVVVRCTSLPQSAAMLLEGEVKVFSIELQNLSNTTSVDLLLFAFQDSTTAPLQAAMSNKDTPPAELYELELLYSRREAFRRRRADGSEPFIGPGQTASFDIEMLGKPGLTNATVQLDYAHLGMPREDVKDKFYTRQVTVPVTVTVNASVELVRVDILPFSSHSSWSRSSDQQQQNGDVFKTPREESFAEALSSPQELDSFQRFFKDLGSKYNEEEYCLLVLDLRNAWPNSLHVTLQLRDLATNSTTAPLPAAPDDDDDDDDDDESWDAAYTVREVLQSGHTSRVVLPLRRLFLPDPHAPIPTLNPANRRQFVLGASKLSPEAERAAREAFWFREHILARLRAGWAEAAGCPIRRRGEVGLRGLRLSPRMVHAVRIDDVGIDLAVLAGGGGDGDGRPVRRLGRATFAVPTETFLTLRARVCNRTGRPIHPLLRLQPSLRHQPHAIALDLAKRFAWTGLLQQSLPPLRPGETVEVALGVCALCRGEFEVGALVEEARLWKGDGDWDGESERKKEGGPLIDRAPGERERERRTWFAREACVLLASDGGAAAAAAAAADDDDGE